MLHSMTGYAKMRAEFPGGTVSVEFRSLNSKYLDLNLKIPAHFKEKENLVRGLIKENLKRGKIDCMISVEHDEPLEQYTLNKALIKTVYGSLQETMGEMDLKAAFDAGAFFQLPDILQKKEHQLQESEWNSAEALIKDVCEKLNQYRLAEGKSLQNDFKQAIEKISAHAETVQAGDKNRIEKIRKRLFQHLNRFLEEKKIDHNRYEQEAIYYIEKLDVTEEISRLSSHLSFFHETLDNDQKEKGKKLSFIAQEIGREINTLGSKLNDAELQRVVVEMKDELEKIKEQTLNTL